MNFRHLLILICIFCSRASFSQVSVLPYVNYPTESPAEVVCIGDVNNDNLNDIVLGIGFYFDSINDYKILIYLQNASGGLNPPLVYPYPEAYPGLMSIDIGDVNNDNLKDVIIGFGDNIGIFYQNTLGSLNPVQNYYSGYWPDGIKTGDLNNDGLTDIAVSHAGDSLKVFYQVAGGFTTKSYERMPIGGFNEVEIADMNNDGLKDVVLMLGAGNGGINIYLQNASGTLDPYLHYYPAASIVEELHGMALGDLNNDGRIDVAASTGGNSPNSYLVLWFQDTVTGLLISPPQIIPAYDMPGPIEIADLNCDGKNDIFIAHTAWLKLSTYEQNTAGTYNNFQLWNLPNGYYNPESLSIGDINQDNKKDIAIANTGEGLIVLYNNSPNTNYQVIDTTVNIDTCFTHFFSNSFYFTTTSIDTLSNYQVTQIDSFLVLKYFREDSIRIDSVFIRTSESCSCMVIDSLKKSYYLYSLLLLGQDTSWFARFIDSLSIVTEILIYPNPGSGLIYAEVPYPYDKEETKLDIYNYLGALVCSLEFTDDSNLKQIDLTKVASGLYLLNFSSLNSRATKKVVIQR